MNYEAEGAVPIYAWQVTVPDGPISLTVGGSAQPLAIPAGPLWGYGATLETTPFKGIQPAFGTVTDALSAAIVGAAGGGSAWHFTPEGNPLCHLRTIYLTPATQIKFASVTQAQFFGFSEEIVAAQSIGGGGHGFVCDMDSAGYWAPKRGLGSHAYRSDPRSRYSKAEYGSGASAAQWGADWWELSAIHRDVKLGMLYPAERNDAAYSVPAGVVQSAPHNLYSEMRQASKQLQEIRLWRRQPFGSPLKLAARGDLAAPEYRETIQGQCQTVALRWRWINYPTGA